MSTGTSRALAIALLAALLHVVAVGAPAHADPDRLRLSIDSETQLFSGAYAPGSVNGVPFTITNESPSRTLATIELIRPVSSGDLAPALEFSATVDGDSPSTNNVPLSPSSGQAQGHCLVLGSAYLSPRETVNAGVTMHMITSENMNQSARFAFRITLRQVTNKGKVNPCTGKSSGAATQVLGAQSTSAKTVSTALKPASSGAVRSSALVAGLAAATLMVGALLLLATRRRRLD